MKKSTFYTLAAMILGIFAFLPAFGQDTPATLPPSEVVPWQLALIPVLTPLIILGIKKLVPQIPGVYLPFVAPVVGCLLDLLSHFTTGTVLSPWLALGLGAAGVGLRELVDQVKKARATPPA